MGTRIKSPVELVVGIQRAADDHRKRRGPDPRATGIGPGIVYPPNVAGWPGVNWIDSSSLMMRMRCPTDQRPGGDAHAQG